MIKFRLYFDKDKETAWLNEMAAKGYALTGFFAGFYRFEECEPGKYSYQIDFGDKFFAVSNSYREFMEEAGIEIVQTWGYWIFLRKYAADGEFQLYTDVDSSIEHYTKIRNMFKVVTIIELLAFYAEVYGAMNGVGLGLIFMVIIGALIFALLRVLIRTNHIIAELKERKGESVSRCAGNAKTSPLLLSGMLLNLCALVAKDSVHPVIVIVLQISAIVLMVVGIYRSRDIFKG